MVGLQGVSGWVLTLGFVLGGVTHGSESVDSGHAKASRFDTVTATRSLGYVDVTKSLLQPVRGPYPEKLRPQNDGANLASDRASILKAGRALTNGALELPSAPLLSLPTARG